MHLLTVAILISYPHLYIFVGLCYARLPMKRGVHVLMNKSLHVQISHFFNITAVLTSLWEVT